MKYDVFISHASEDKLQVALPLAYHLKRNGLNVWIDEFELTLGDSLRRVIDLGLSESRFGVVILSPEFFRKGWTNRELDGLVAREDGKDKVILPIWHNVTIEDVLRFSPTLAGKLGVSTSQGIEFVANQISRAIKKEPKHREAQFRLAPSRDRIAFELSLIRKEMLLASSRWEFREVLFKVEDFLSRYPNHPEARLLRESIKESMWYHEAPGKKAEETHAVPPAEFVLITLLLALLRYPITWVILGVVLLIYLLSNMK